MQLTVEDVCKRHLSWTGQHRAVEFLPYLQEWLSMSQSQYRTAAQKSEGLCVSTLTIVTIIKVKAFNHPGLQSLSQSLIDGDKEISSVDAIS